MNSTKNENTSSIFANIHTIAIIGLSDNSDRYSYQVAKYLQSQGFTIIPVNPNAARILGERAYSTLQDIPPGVKVDTVDIFRSPEFVFEHIREAVERDGVHTIWLQEGISHEHAENYAREHGLTVMSNMCMMKVHKMKKA